MGYRHSEAIRNGFHPGDFPDLSGMSMNTLCFKGQAGYTTVRVITRESAWPILKSQQCEAGPKPSSDSSLDDDRLFIGHIPRCLKEGLLSTTRVWCIPGVR